MRRTVTVLVIAGLLSGIGVTAWAAEGPETAPATQAGDPLVRVLAAKGILSAQEAQALSALPADQQRDQLTAVLLKKGIISQTDLQSPSVSNERLLTTTAPTTAATVKPAVMVETVSTSPKPQAAAAPAPKPPAVIPAVAPLRVLQLEPAKPGGMIPDINLGSKVKMKIYGLIKASAIYDSSSPYGTDEPLPGFITSLASDTGPTGASEFHVKARFARVGANFEFPDLSPKIALTGKIEGDYEGNYTRVLNRNISTIRSNQFSLRLAWGRVDYKFNNDTNFFALFGQDWTPFGSSTLPNLFETTGLGLGFATLYERSPQFRIGIGHNIGGSRKLFIQPEFAILMPAYGDNPADPWNQIYYGERQGADATRPDIQGRLVTQWQLDKAPGVAPAQLIFSFVQGQRASNVTTANIKAATSSEAATLCPLKDPVLCGQAQTAILAAYPHGVQVKSDRWGWSGEVQLPTRWFTLLGKYWAGADLRWYFVGDLLSYYNNVFAAPAGTTLIGVPNVDGVSSTGGFTVPPCSTAKLSLGRSVSCVAFAFTPGGTATVIPQRPFRDYGAFVNLSFPLGRLFHADPAGRNAGWQLHLHYGLDDVPAGELRRFGNANVNKNDLAAATLIWKLNSLISFSWEQSMYRSRTVSGFGATGLPLYRGNPARNWHDNRSEFGTIFTF